MPGMRSSAKSTTTAARSHATRAALVQTEDLGKTFSTAPLRYQAAHENERRWLSLDLLCGRVTPDQHPVRAEQHLLDLGGSDVDPLQREAHVDEHPIASSEVLLIKFEHPDVDLARSTGHVDQRADPGA